jgi:hypothetical protein
MAKSIPKVSGMDWVLEHITQPKLEPDEFTVQMIVDKSGATDDSIRGKLQRMRKRGELTSRKIVLDGTPTNAYKRVEA